jgi:hypothetical protein
MKEINSYRLASVFLRDVKAAGITYKRLKQVLFGDAAIAFIGAVKKHGQKAFTSLKKEGQFMYLVKSAFEYIKQKDNE